MLFHSFIHIRTPIRQISISAQQSWSPMVNKCRAKPLQLVQQLFNKIIIVLIINLNRISTALIVSQVEWRLADCNGWLYSVIRPKGPKVRNNREQSYWNIHSRALYVLVKWSHGMFSGSGSSFLSCWSVWRRRIARLGSRASVNRLKV